MLLQCLIYKLLNNYKIINLKLKQFICLLFVCSIAGICSFRFGDVVTIADSRFMSCVVTEKFDEY